MMRHRENSMSACTSTNNSNPEDVWFINSGASNHMTSHHEWLQDLRESDRLGYVETVDDTTHRNRHVGNVPFGKEGEQTCIKNVLHVPTITKSWSRSTKLWSKGCKFDSTKVVASSRRKVDSSRMAEGKVKCLSSSRTR